MANGMQMTLDEWMPEAFPLPIAGASARLAKTSVMPTPLEEGLTEIAVPSFVKYFASLGKCGKKIDLNGSSMKMLKECYRATEDLTSLPFSLNWMNAGMTSNGSYSTVKTSAFRKTESESTLSDILEDTVSEKYFLSENFVKRIVRMKDTDFYILTPSKESIS